MKTNSLRSVFLFLLLLSLLFSICSCGDGAKRIGPEGGEVKSFDGRLTLSIPPGALSSEVKISAIRRSELDSRGMIAYILEPSGLQFNTPIEASINLGTLRDEEEIPVTVFLNISENGTIDVAEDQSIIVDENQITWKGRIRHFSTLAAALDDVTVLFRNIPRFTPGDSPFRLPVQMKLTRPSESSIIVDRVSYLPVNQAPVALGEEVVFEDFDLGPLNENIEQLSIDVPHRCNGFGIGVWRGSAVLEELVIDSKGLLLLLFTDAEINSITGTAERILIEKRQVLECIERLTQPENTTSLVESPGGTTGPQEEENSTEETVPQDSPEETNESTPPAKQTDFQITSETSLSFEHTVRESPCPQEIGQIRVRNTGTEVLSYTAVASPGLSVSPTNVAAATGEEVVFQVRFVCDPNFSSGTVSISAQSEETSITREVAVSGTIK